MRAMTSIDRSVGVHVLVSFHIALAAFALLPVSAQGADGTVQDTNMSRTRTGSNEQDTSMAYTTENKNEDENEGLSAGAVAGIAVGVFILVILVMLLCIKCRRTRPERGIKSVDTKDTEDPTWGADIGSHNTHAIDVHRCASGSCEECGNKLESPIKFHPANGSKDVEGIREDAEPKEGFEEVDISSDDLGAAAASRSSSSAEWKVHGEYVYRR
mmetsp:Transcript_5147/g.11201  ORF Transcript_5147/g.11201 Transcript_5147/m.11201 type:complete len:214 (+) Transcript_5147:409-1050(+)